MFPGNFPRQNQPPAPNQQPINRPSFPQQQYQAPYSQQQQVPYSQQQQQQFLSAQHQAAYSAQPSSPQQPFHYGATPSSTQSHPSYYQQHQFQGSTSPTLGPYPQQQVPYQMPSQPHQQASSQAPYSGQYQQPPYQQHQFHSPMQQSSRPIGADGTFPQSHAFYQQSQPPVSSMHQQSSIPRQTFSPPAMMQPPLSSPLPGKPQVTMMGNMAPNPNLMAMPPSSIPGTVPSPTLQIAGPGRVSGSDPLHEIFKSIPVRVHPRYRVLCYPPGESPEEQALEQLHEQIKTLPRVEHLLPDNIESLMKVPLEVKYSNLRQQHQEQEQRKLREQEIQKQKIEAEKRAKDHAAEEMRLANLRELDRRNQERLSRILSVDEVDKFKEEPKSTISPPSKTQSSQSQSFSLQQTRTPSLEDIEVLSRTSIDRGTTTYNHSSRVQSIDQLTSQFDKVGLSFDGNVESKQDAEDRRESFKQATVSSPKTISTSTLEKTSSRASFDKSLPENVVPNPLITTEELPRQFIQSMTPPRPQSPSNDSSSATPVYNANFLYSPVPKVHAYSHVLIN